MSEQSANAVVMIRPSRFYPNPETALDNAFQRRCAITMSLQLVCLTNTVTAPRLDCTRRHRRRELIGDLVGPFAIGGHNDLGRLDSHQRGEM